VVAGAVALGLVAGIAAALFLTITGEPSIEEAIRLEHRSHAAEGEVVSRGVQKGAGLFAAYALTGVAFGLLFAAAYTALRRGRPDPFRRALVAGAVLAGALTVSPWLKYPPNPPAVGDPDTLSRRQLLYAALILLSVVVLAAAAHVSRRLREAGWTEARRVVAVVAGVALAMLLLYGVLPPAPDAVGVPATLVWRFRLASLGGNLLLWTGLALGFGVLAGEPARARAR
jgi:predicted cobalt transporter CbtA